MERQEIFSPTKKREIISLSCSIASFIKNSVKSVIQFQIMLQNTNTWFHEISSRDNIFFFFLSLSSHFCGKHFVSKSIIDLTKYFLGENKFLIFPHRHDLFTLWKLWNFTAMILSQKFRQTFTKELYSESIRRKKMRSNVKNI